MDFLINKSFFYSLIVFGIANSILGIIYCASIIMNHDLNLGLSIGYLSSVVLIPFFVIFIVIQLVVAFLYSRVD